MDTSLILAITSGFLFGIWPVMSKFAKPELSSDWITVLVAVPTMLIAFVGIKTPPPSILPFSLGIIAGVLNGAGLVLYGLLIGWKGLDISKIGPIVMIVMPIATVIGSWLVLGEPLSVKKLLGLATAVISIYLLSIS